MAHFNNEPFLGSIQDEDFLGACRDAGFDPAQCSVGAAPHRRRDIDPASPSGSSFLVVSARSSPA
jgi:hypothetical protein